MPPSRPMKIPKSVIDLIWPGNLVVAIERRGELGPRVRLALLDTERDTTTIFVDLEHHDFDFFTNLHDA